MAIPDRSVPIASVHFGMHLFMHKMRVHSLPSFAFSILFICVITAICGIDPCQRQPFYSTCYPGPNASSSTSRSQVVIRYYRRGNECIAYPYGLCKNDVAAAKLFRYQHKCEKTCLKRTDFTDLDGIAVPPPPVAFITDKASIKVDPREDMARVNKTHNDDIIKAGVCPFPELGEYAVCVRECLLDYECPRDLKCCYNGCGRLCLQPKPVEGDPCTQTRDHGGCYGYFRRWWYDSGINGCKQFIYGGCAGNGNNFLSESECLDRCSKGDLAKPTMNTTQMTFSSIPPAEHWSTEVSNWFSESSPTASTAANGPDSTVSMRTTDQTNGSVTFQDAFGKVSMESVAASTDSVSQSTDSMPQSTDSASQSTDSMSQSTEGISSYEPDTTLSSRHGSQEPTTQESNFSTLFPAFDTVPTGATVSNTSEYEFSSATDATMPPSTDNETVSNSATNPIIDTVGSTTPEEDRHVAGSVVTKIDYIVPAHSFPSSDATGSPELFTNALEVTSSQAGSSAPTPPSTDLIYCPHNRPPLKSSSGDYVTCLPSTDDPVPHCPESAACSFNGLNFYCCPDVELLFETKNMQQPEEKIDEEDNGGETEGLQEIEDVFLKYKL